MPVLPLQAASCKSVKSYPQPVGMACWTPCQAPYPVIAVFLLEQCCALIVWRAVYDSLDRLQVAIVTDLCIQLPKDTKQANEMAQESIKR